MSEKDPLAHLIESVSDGAPVDWDSAGAVAQDPSASAEVAALQDVARIADFNRALQRAGAEQGSREPERWGELLLLERIGAGQSGDVFRAWDPSLQRELALKVLRGEGGAAGDAALLGEARGLARLVHPNIVAVHAIHEHAGRIGIAMEYLRGGSLAERIEREGALPAAEVARIGAAVARALSAVQAAGMVHRDVKPANIVLESAGRVVLTDFGLGRARHEADSEPLRLSGTPMFLSAARLAGESATIADDLHALGVTLWWALTKTLPYEARTLGALRVEVARGPARDLAALAPEAPALLRESILRALGSGPAITPEDFARACDTVANGAAPAQPSAESRTQSLGDQSRRGGLLALVAVVALVAFVLLRARTAPPKATPAPAVTAAPAAPATVASEAPYNVQAAIVRRKGSVRERLGDGDRVRVGDALSLEFRASRPAWVYVVNEDEQGHAYLLFPQPRFDLRDPLPADTSLVLPGTLGGREQGWAVTSRGGREHFLVIASPQPVPELEKELAALPPADPSRPIVYAPVPAASMERLRGVGGLTELPASPAAPHAGALERFRALADRAEDVRGVWVRKVTLENPLH